MIFSINVCYEHTFCLILFALDPTLSFPRARLTHSCMSSSGASPSSAAPPCHSLGDRRFTVSFLHAHDTSIVWWESTLGLYSFGLIFVSARTNTVRTNKRHHHQRHHHHSVPLPTRLEQALSVPRGLWTVDRGWTFPESSTVPVVLHWHQ